MNIIKILTISFCIIMMLTQSVMALGLNEIMSMGGDWTNTGKEHTGKEE